MIDLSLSDLRLLINLVRLEGFAAARDRALDRLEGRRRLRGLPSVAPGEPLLAKHREPPLVLNVSPLPPFPRRGGVQLQMLHRLDTVARTHAVCLLYPTSAAGWRLEWWDGPARARVDLRDPATVAEAIGHAALQIGTRTVHIENLAGVPGDITAQLQAQGFDVVLSVHDFSSYCRRPHLMERPMGRFCEYSSDDDRCVSCLRCDWPVDDDEPRRHRLRTAETLASSRALVFPSEFARDQHKQLFRVAAARWNAHVITPATLGLSVASERVAAADHVAFVGGLQLHKGALLVPHVAQSLSRARPSVRMTVFGGGDLEIARRTGDVGRLRIRGYYRAGALPALLQRNRVSVAVLPSVWPETYGLVVDECLSAGVPVVVFDTGAPAVRLAAKGLGAIVPATLGAAGLSDAIDRILERLPHLQSVELPSPDGAAVKHLDLYASLERSCA